MISLPDSPIKDGHRWEKIAQRNYNSASMVLVYSQSSQALRAENSNCYTGSGLKIVKQKNVGSMMVTGNGCFIRVTENEGVVRVTGNGCQIVVERGCGKIEYCGNGGMVTTGPEVDRKLVTYSGHGGVVNNQPIGSVEEGKSGGNLKCCKKKVFEREFGRIYREFDELKVVVVRTKVNQC